FCSTRLCHWCSCVESPAIIQTYLRKILCIFSRIHTYFRVDCRVNPSQIHVFPHARAIVPFSPVSKHVYVWPECGKRWQKCMAFYYYSSGLSVNAMAQLKSCVPKEQEIFKEIL